MNENKKANSFSEIRTVEVTNDRIVVIARCGLLDENGKPTTYAEDMVEFDRKMYTTYMMIRAILNGVQCDSSIVMFSPDEYTIAVNLNDNIDVKIYPNKDVTKMAYIKLLESISSDIYMASRSISTIAIRRAFEKIGIQNFSAPGVLNTNIDKIEKQMVIEKKKLKVFEVAKEKNIPIIDLQKASVEITGQKSSSKWTEEDIDKMLEFVNNK